MKDNTVTTVDGVEVYTSQITEIADRYIADLEDIDSIYTYEVFTDLLLYISDNMTPLNNYDDITVLDNLFNISKYTESNKETKIIVNADWVKKHVLFKARTEYQPKSDYGKMMGFLLSYSVRGKNPHDDVPDGLASFALFVQNLIGATVTTYSRAALGI